MDDDNSIERASGALERIRNKIYEIRGKKVMLDRDLAELYHVETRRLNEAVKRNIERFPLDFMFQLSKEEVHYWMSQIATSNSIKMGLRKLPYAFTELGVAMLSSVLNSKEAIQVNINIMRAFVQLRQALSELAATNLRVEQLSRRVDQLDHYVDDILRDQNDINEATATQIDLIQDSLAELHAEKLKQEEDSKRRRIGFRIDQEKENN